MVSRFQTSFDAYGLGQIERIDTGLHCADVVTLFWLVQFVVSEAFFLPDVRIGIASPLTPGVALDAAKGLVFELII